MAREVRTKKEKKVACRKLAHIWFMLMPRAPYAYSSFCRLIVRTELWSGHVVLRPSFLLVYYAITLFNLTELCIASSQKSFQLSYASATTSTVPYKLRCVQLQCVNSIKKIAVCTNRTCRNRGDHITSSLKESIVYTQDSKSLCSQVLPFYNTSYCGARRKYCIAELEKMPSIT